MGSFSIWHWIIVLVIVLLLFGAGKLPNVMGDIAKGVKAFKAGMKDEDEAPTTTASTQAPPTAIHPAQAAADPVTTAPASATPAPATPAGQPHPVDPAKPHQG